MKILCKSATQVFGYGIVSKGEHIEWPDGKPFPPQVIGNFVEVGSGAKLFNKEPQPASPLPISDAPNAAADKPADGGSRQPTLEEAAADKPADGGSRQPTLEEAAAEQARAEKVAKDELVKRTAALGKQKLIAALDASGVPYASKATCEELAKALLRSQGQDID